MQHINDILNKHQYLNLINSNVFDIPQRLKEYDPSFFIVYNCKDNRMEVHSLENKGDTFCMVVPYKELDERTLTLVRKNDIKTRGRKIFEEIDRQNEKLELNKKSYMKDMIRNAGEEVYQKLNRKKAVI